MQGQGGGQKQRPSPQRQALASIVSRVVSDLLNRITNAEVKRAAFGNDTEGEVALGATDRPVWLEPSTLASET